MKRRVIGVLLLIVTLVVGLGLWLLWPDDQPVQRERRAVELPQQALGVPEALAPDGGPVPAARAVSEMRRRTVGTPAQEAERERSRALAAAFRHRLDEARTARLGGSGAPSAAAEDEEEPLGRLEPQYIRDAVQQITPLIRECYEMASEAAESEGGQPPEGRLIAEFEIVGEESVGGVIESSEISEESDIAHPLLDECLRETLYTLELPAPEGGGRVTVRYPFTFRQDPEAPE